MQKVSVTKVNWLFIMHNIMCMHACVRVCACVCACACVCMCVRVCIFVSQMGKYFIFCFAVNVNGDCMEVTE